MEMCPNALTLIWFKELQILHADILSVVIFGTQIDWTSLYFKWVIHVLKWTASPSLKTPRIQKITMRTGVTSERHIVFSDISVPRMPSCLICYIKLMLDVISYEIQKLHLKLHVDLSRFMEILWEFHKNLWGNFLSNNLWNFSVKFYNCWEYAVRLYVESIWVGY